MRIFLHQLSKIRFPNYLIDPVDVVADDNFPVDEGHRNETEPEEDRSYHGETGSADEDVCEDVENSCTEVEGGEDQHVGSAHTEDVNEDNGEYPNDQILKAVSVAGSATHDSLCVFVTSLGLILYDGKQHCGVNVIPGFLVA